MECWSPEDAMKAYLHTLQLCRTKSHEGTSCRSTTLVEPKCMKFISTWAARKQARLKVEVSTEGITPLTIGLAVAAKQTGGELICYPLHDHQEDIKKSKAHFIGQYLGLEDGVELVYGNPFEVIMKYKNIGFTVIDGKLGDHLRLLVKMIDVNPSGSIIVGHNLQYTRFAQVLSGKNGVEAVSTLPMGEGMELARIGSLKKRESRKHKRFHVTFEN